MQTYLNKRTSRVLIAAAIVVLALTASACGGGKKSTSTTTGAAATEQWAGSVCSAFTTWKTSLQHITSSLTSGGMPSSSDLRQAGRQFEDATNTLTKSLKKLGPPNTSGGQAAKDNLTTLENNLSQSLTAIEDTLKSTSSVTGLANAIPTLTTQFGKMKSDLTQTANELKKADPGGELEQAFKQAPACSAYVKS
jgi:hypothetical protein